MKRGGTLGPDDVLKEQFPEGSGLSPERSRLRPEHRLRNTRGGTARLSEHQMGQDVMPNSIYFVQYSGNN